MNIKVDDNIIQKPNAGKTFPVYLVKSLFVVVKSVLKIKYILLNVPVRKGCNLHSNIKQKWMDILPQISIDKQCKDTTEELVERL